MPHFTITTPGGRKVEIDAPDEAAAVAGAKQYVQRYPDPATAPKPGSGPRPEEMSARTRSRRPEPPARGRAAENARHPDRENWTPLDRHTAAATLGFAQTGAGQVDAAGGASGPTWNRIAEMSGHPELTRKSAMDTLNDFADFTPEGSERTSQTFGGLAGGALLPGSLLQRAKNVVMPFVGGEAAAGAVGALGGDQNAQDAARFGGQIVGGVGAGVRARGNPAAAESARPNARPAARPAARPPEPPRARPAPIENLEGARVKPKVAAKARARLNRALDHDEQGGHTTRAQVADRILKGERPWSAGGPNLQMLAEDAANQPGPSRARLERSAQTARENLPNEVEGAIAQGTGARGDQLAHLEEIRQQRLTNAAPLRDRAFAAPVDPVAYQERVAPIMQRVPKSALGRAYEIARREGRNPEEIGLRMQQPDKVFGFGPGEPQPDIVLTNPTFETLHYVKKGMDQELAQFRDGFGRLDLEGQPLAQATAGVRSDLGRALRGINGDYDTFMQTWGDDSELVSAYGQGRGALTGRGGLRGQQLAANFEELSAQGKDEYRRGIGEALLDEVRQRGDVTAMRGLLRNREIADRVRLAFPGQSFDDFMAHADRIVRRQNAANEILRNSATARRQAVRAEGEAPDPSGYVGDAITLDIRNAANRAVGDATRNATRGVDWGDSRAVRDLIGHAMDDPALFDRLIAEAEKSPMVTPAQVEQLKQLALRYRPEFTGASAAAGALAAQQGTAHRQQPEQR